MHTPKPKPSATTPYNKASEAKGGLLFLDTYGRPNYIEADSVIGITANGYQQIVVSAVTPVTNNVVNYALSTNYDTFLKAMIVARRDGVCLDLRAACNLEESDPLAADYRKAAPDSPTEAALTARIKVISPPSFY